MRGWLPPEMAELDVESWHVELGQAAGRAISQPPIPQGDLPEDDDTSGLRRFVRRRSAALVLIAVVVLVLAVYLVISLT